MLGRAAEQSACGGCGLCYWCLLLVQEEVTQSSRVGGGCSTGCFPRPVPAPLPLWLCSQTPPWGWASCPGLVIMVVRVVSTCVDKGENRFLWVAPPPALGSSLVPLRFLPAHPGCVGQQGGGGLAAATAPSSMLPHWDFSLNPFPEGWEAASADPVSQGGGRGAGQHGGEYLEQGARAAARWDGGSGPCSV